ncbi:MAG: NAD(P)/FAD-dependent oxidoreductase [Bacteroidales bacterium]|jgi:all-trans-retinol 13,14-reductase|nr:NAD(P)/FAD-dependent oxidoreductase [Bacteroidales bacterium]
MEEKKYDIIIVGSGLGGLVCGYILSKNGYNTCIVEKNKQIGGCLQTFTRGGIKFDTGMHYIGSMEETQILYRFFRYLNLLDVPLSRLDNLGYDVISIGGEKYKYASGFDNFIETLSEKFPDNIADIKEYVRRIREIADASPLYKLQEINSNVFIEADYIKTSVNEFIESVTENKRLQSVLTGILPLYAGVKNKTPTYIHALINNFYIQSAWRIIGGSDKIAKSLAKSIKSFGGEILTNSEVVEFVCNETKTTSVKLKDGRELKADYFISNIHPQVMMEKIQTKIIRKAYCERIAGLENTISNFTVFLKFKKDKLPYLNYNFYYYENENIWETTDYDEKLWPESFLYMHQISDNNTIFAESAQIIGYMRFDEVKKWENTIVGKRGKEYEKFKQEKAKLLIDKLEKSFPGTKDAIEFYYTSSPLTYRDYTATKNGSLYGIIRDKNFPIQTLVSQRTKIPNLLMTGQNINSHGVLGVIIGAMITCAEFLGMNHIIRDIDNSNS